MIISHFGDVNSPAVKPYIGTRYDAENGEENGRPSWKRKIRNLWCPPLKLSLKYTWSQVYMLLNLLSDFVIAMVQRNFFKIRRTLKNLVHGFAPSWDYYNISTNSIFGNLSQDISRNNFALKETILAVK